MEINKLYPGGGGGLNADDTDIKLSETEYINLQDFRWGSTDKGTIGMLECVGSTVMINNYFKPQGNNICIRGGLDRPNRRAVLCYWNDQGNHSIFCFDYINNRLDPMIYSHQVVGGLNFDRYHLVDGRVENGCFYWTDNYNEPRRINIQYALEMNFDPDRPLPGYIQAGALPTPFVDHSGTTLNVYYEMPLTPVPSYQSGLLQALIVRKGSGGPNVGPTNIDIIAPNVGNQFAWNQYPLEKSCQQIIEDAFANYFTNINPSGSNAGSLEIKNNHPGAFVVKNWDWNLGDPSFAPTLELDLELTNWLREDGQTTNPYIAPLSQAVIAWIRRQPGLPPTQVKVLDSPVPTVNFIDKSAFQFAYRYQYKTKEYSTLSGRSSLADFNEGNVTSIETSLEVPNKSLTTRGYLATNILLPTPDQVSPAYGPNVLMRLLRQGTGGADAGNERIPVPLDWTGYPATKSYTAVIVEGLNNYFKARPSSDNPGNLTPGVLPETPGGDSGLNYKWYISYRDGQHPTLNILETWDWGLGDPSFPPTTVANVELYTETLPPSRSYNRIDVAIPFAEVIDQDVLQIDLIANSLVENSYSIIKSWQASNADDAAAIIAHNAGTTQLKYSFYNNTAPIVIDPSYAIKPFDAVPNLACAIEMAKNRGFMGNFTAGYDSQDLLTSLAISFTSTPIGSPPGTAITGEWFLLKFIGGILQSHTVYILRTVTALSLQPYSPYYYYTIPGAAPPFPATISFGLEYLGPDINTVMTTIINESGQRGPGILISLTDQNASSTLQAETPSSAGGVLAKVFKQNAPYMVSVSFLDNFGRKGGIVTNGNLLVTIPNTGFSNNQYVTALNWTLDNTNAVQQIPDSAYYYSVNITKCLRTRFFVEAIGFPIYANKDSSGNYTFSDQVYSSDFAGIGIDISFLAANGMGYSFTPGDIMNFYLGSTNYTSSIIGQVGNYVILQLLDIGTLSSATTVLYEIYTPYKAAPATIEPHYEIGQIYPVQNPGQANRAYSITAGSIGGDVYLFQRENFSIPYIAEAMSPNDTVYQYWFTDAGRPNAVDYIGKVSRASSICFSNTYISGSADNGLSTFDALDNTDLSPDFGPIQKLQLASKISKIGTVMLAICSGPQTASIYLGENTLVSAEGASTVGQSNTVIGSVHQLKGDYGTLNPESVVEFHGDIFWWDVQNGKIIQYADDGLFPISQYKLSRATKLFSDQYKSMTPQQIEAFGGRPFIVGMIDPHHNELLFTIPSTLATPPKGFLPDYPGTPWPWDIWDGQGKTLSYKLSANPNKWQGSMSFTPEYMFEIEDNLFLVKNGDVYKANQTDSYCNYFGVQYQPKAMVVFNKETDYPKTYKNCSVQGNAAPLLAYFMTMEPWLQSTDLITSDFQNKEGKWVARLYNNKLDPKYNGNYPFALIKGENMRGSALYGLFVFDASQAIIQVKFINAGYNLSEGVKLGALQ